MFHLFHKPDIKPQLLKAYMEVAFTFAKQSTSNRLKVGAIIVKDGSILSHGWNGTPTGFKTNKCELGDGTTSPFVLHAEENAIIKMAKSTESIDGADIFCTHAPCPNCSKLLAQGGIRTVYYSEPYRNLSGLEVLRQLGVKVVKLKHDRNRS